MYMAKRSDKLTAKYAYSLFIETRNGGMNAYSLSSCSEDNRGIHFRQKHKQRQRKQKQKSNNNKSRRGERWFFICHGLIIMLPLVTA